MKQKILIIDDELKKRLFNLGISEFLTKPIDRVKLKEIITDLIEH